MKCDCINSRSLPYYLLYMPLYCFVYCMIAHAHNRDVLKTVYLLYGGGWSGGAMVLSKLPVPGRPTNLD